MTINDIKNYIDNYVIQNGKVYLKSNNQQVLDEEIILKVKSARLIYNEARENFQSDTQQFGKPNGDFPKYVSKMMEQLSVNGEVNTYGTNKLINALLSSNGHYEEYMSGDDLANSKFSILTGVKQDYGLAYLKMKFREKGLDIDNLVIKTRGVKQANGKNSGQYTVIIDFQLKKYEKKVDVSNQQTTVQTSSDLQKKEEPKFFTHPKADLLNELEKQKKDALANNDEVAYNFAQSNIERIIRENQVQVSPEQWDSMTYDERKAFILIKMKESKVLNDEVSFNFWNSNLKQLEEKKQETPVNTQVSQNITSPITPQEEQSMQNKTQYAQSTIENSETLYDKMISALRKSRTDNLTQDEKKQIVGEIYYYEGFLVESLKDEKDIGDVLTKAMQDFSNSQFEQSVLSSLISELQEKLKIVSPKKGEELKVDDGSILSNINILRQEMTKLSAEYDEIRSDGKVDDQELDYLITRMQELYRTAMSLKGNNLSPKEYQIVNEIIASISNERRKMTIFRSDIEQSIQGFSR